jgi:ABC transporter DrrB family efflux protein
VTTISLRRFSALARKELLQVKRDPMTLRIILMMPIMQLLVFGYAINANPKDLPAGLLLAEPSKYERTIVAALENTGYYKIVTVPSEAEAERQLAQGTLVFVIAVPPGFDRAVDRGEVPKILIDTDGSDPSAIVNATSALGGLGNVLARDLPPNLQSVGLSAPFRFIIHTRYNPEQITTLNVVPGLICIVLMVSTFTLTTIAITREREAGTMENLLAMPVRPIEVMLAKISPYIVIGYIQVVVILTVAAFLFDLPVRGPIFVLLTVLGIYICANLALGIMISTFATNQIQAEQMAQMAMLPSMILSGFIFPFQGMPSWARYVGELLPTTHAIRILRGLLLKGSSWQTIQIDLWPIAVFALVAMIIAAYSYRETIE